MDNKIRREGQRIRVKQCKPVQNCKETAGWFKAKDQNFS